MYELLCMFEEIGATYDEHMSQEGKVDEQTVTDMQVSH